MSEFNDFKDKYKEFIYKSYEIIDNKNEIKIKYYFEIPGLSEFEPTITINKKNIKFRQINNKVRNLVFNLGMVEAISYWKCSCAKNFVIECGFFNKKQIAFFSKLFYLGLGEFRYINNIKVTENEFIHIECRGEELKLEKDSDKLIGSLIPIGGGKDSTVTLELLRKDINNNLCIIIGSKEPSMKCAEIGGYKLDKIIEVKRTIDRRLLSLNEEGYLNGHTPFSAMLSFLSYLIAYMTYKKYVPLSNESSANESNVSGEKINHQYSKTLEYENDFRHYADKYLQGEVEYFSMLRPLNELQIAMLFSKNEKYYKVFKSCNVGSKQIPWVWCCNCPKCLFVYIIMSPFLYKTKLINIFGEDLFEKKQLLKTFIELCGYGETKPFECVGTYEEINFALTKLILKLENENEELPYLLKYYKNNFKLHDISENILERYSNENNLPKHFERILKEKLF